MKKHKKSLKVTRSTIKQIAVTGVVGGTASVVICQRPRKDRKLTDFRCEYQVGFDSDLC